MKNLQRFLTSTMSDIRAKRPRLLSMKEKSYFESYCDITVHEEMLGDGERTNAYKRAIFSHASAIKNKVVLDVGAGTGILSCFCAQAGAAKVYAVEASRIAEQARKVVLQNGLQDQIEVIEGIMEEVVLPQKVDVIVSEWMGYCLLYESMLSSVICARDRWLKPGGLILPDSATIYIAPICDDEVMVEKVNFWNDMEEAYGVDMSSLIPFARESLSKEVMVKYVSSESVLSNEQVVVEFDLYNVNAKDLVSVHYDFHFKCFGIADLQGFAVWFTMKFSEPRENNITANSNCGENSDHNSLNHCNDEIKKKNVIELSTSPYKPETHWKQSVLYFDSEIPVQQDSDIKGWITLRPEKHNPRFLSVTLNADIDNYSTITKNYSMGYELPKSEDSTNLK